METKQKKIKIKYVFSKDYNPVFANGAYGGINIKGEIVINFFQDRSPLPKSITYNLNEDGALGDIVEKDPSDYDKMLIRYITTGVTINYDNAKSIHSWLGKLLKEFEKGSDPEKEQQGE